MEKTPNGVSEHLTVQVVARPRDVAALGPIWANDEDGKYFSDIFAAAEEFSRRLADSVKPKASRRKWMDSDRKCLEARHHCYTLAPSHIPLLFFCFRIRRFL